MKKNNTMLSLLSGVALASLVACSGGSDVTNPVNTTTSSSSGTAVIPTVDDSLIDSIVANVEDSTDYVWDSSATTYITLNKTSIAVVGSGATVSGTTVTITAGKPYNITGTLDDGQVIVNSADTEVVTLILNEVSITNSSGPAILVEQAEKTVVSLADNTQNILTDGSTYATTDTTVNGALFSRDDITLFGNGTLTVNGNYKDGIVCKDKLVISSGTITVNSIDDGIRGKDYVAIIDGNITVKAGGDGLKSTNDSDATRGYVSIAGGVLNINAGADGIQAETDVNIAAGTFTMTTTSKAIKATRLVSICGGSFEINSSDDAIHSNGHVIIEGGSFTISSGDDGIHGDSSLTMNGGDILITKSYEGIESTTLTINGGTIHLTSSDDGVNVAGGADGSAAGNFGGMMSSGNASLIINGGYLVVNANGDGLDANGSITMTNGMVIVNGPTGNGNGALDYDQTFKLSGGIIVAVGSSGMAMAPSTSSTQNSVLINLSSSQQAKNIIHIASSTGEDLLTFAPAKAYQSVVFSSPNLVNGSYTVSLGGSSTGTVTDGLYSDGVYTAGTQYTTFTVASVVTNVGSNGGGMGF